MSLVTDYRLLNTKDDNDGIGWSADYVDTRNYQSSRNIYPGNRRTIIVEDEREDVIFLRTGGNALQAIPRESILRQNMIKIIVPEGTYPGDEIYVPCALGTDRIFSVIIPSGTTAGSVLLVQVPDHLPNIATGTVVDLSQRRNPTPMGQYSDVGVEDDLLLQQDLVLQSENEPEPLSAVDEEDYVMIEKREIL